MFTKELIAGAINNLKLIVWENAFLKTPSWDQFITHAHEKYWDTSYVPYARADNKEYSVGGVFIRGKHYFMVMDATSDYFPETIEVLKTLNSLIDSEFLYPVSFVNFIANEPGINIHSDPRHSFYWQTKGNSTWKMWDKKPEKVDENGLAVEDEPDQIFYVKEGDLIFVPHGVYHSVDTPSPRSAISFTYKADLTSCKCHKKIN